MKGEIAMLYRALRPLGLFPPVIRAMELWECAVLLGRDERDELILPTSTQFSREKQEPQGELGLTMATIDFADRDGG